ncbi:glycosyltransferase [bacterium]|nr:glycosyltransferase [bacterium]
MRLLLARYRYHNRIVPTLRGLREVPGYKAIIKSWRNKYRGRRCFVIGNGPSLNRMDLSPLKNEITIGCNAIYKNFAQWGWHTHYLLFEDIEQTELRRRDIPNVKGPVKLLGLHNAYAIKPDANTFFMNVRNLDAAFMDEQFPQFSKDFGHIVHLASTVTYIGLQLAWHLGCDPVYLIGVDHNYGELPRLYPPCKITITGDNYDLIRGIHVPQDNYTIGDVIGVPPVDYMEAGYRKAREAFEEDGRRVLNAGLDSKLDVFEKADFVSLFAKPARANISNKKSKILFITHDVGRLGAQMSLLGLIRRLRADHGIDCRILVREPNGTLLDEFKALGETEIFWPANEPRKPGPHQEKLRDSIRAWSPDLIYSNTSVNGDVTDYLDSIAPVVVHVHELEWYLKTLDEARHQALTVRPALYIACSQAVRRNLIENHHIPTEKIEVVYESIDFDDVRGKTNLVSREQIRRTLGIPRDAIVIGNCGRIDDRKGWRHFIDIAERVIQDEKDRPVYFMWIGHGPNREELLGEAKHRRISERVIAPGPQENPYPYFNSMDIALVTSVDDPFPLVVMEAAFHGCPVCAFASAGGACEFIGTDCGVSIPDVDPEAMAGKILELVHDPELRRRLGENARKASLDYDTKPIANQIAGILKERFGVDARPHNAHGSSRMLAFPPRAVGKLQIRDAGAKGWSWKDLGPAAGEVEIPQGQEVLFMLERDAAGDLSFLDALDGNDIQSMFLGRTQLNDVQLEHGARLGGLLTLDLRETALSDRCADHLAKLAALKSLVLPSQISDTAVARIKQALPKCNVTKAEGAPVVAQSQPNAARVVTFPNESIGLLMYRPWGLNVWNWTELGPARGEVTVPPKSELMLVVSRKCAADLSALSKLKPDDIQSIHMRQAAIGDDQLAHLARLTGLRTLDLRDSKITDAGVTQLRDLPNLKMLLLPEQISASARAGLKTALRECRIG